VTTGGQRRADLRLWNGWLSALVRAAVVATNTTSRDVRDGLRLSKALLGRLVLLDRAIPELAVRPAKGGPKVGQNG
jgi:hypothetical protein